MAKWRDTADPTKEKFLTTGERISLCRQSGGDGARKLRRGAQFDIVLKSLHR
jgi:hypothetical protein